MDVTRLYNLTTLELQDEAQRLGIRDARALSRAQLIHAIRDRAPAQREGFIGKVFGIARRAMKEANRSPQPSPPRRSGAAPAGVFSSRTATTGAAATPAPRHTPAPSAYDEPFPTRTMARILAAQGHYKRALAIYGALLRDDPREESLREEADEVRKSAHKALRVTRSAS